MTELVFILDRSGSMAGLEKDTIGGFNSMLEKQRKEPGDAVVSTVLFDNETEVIHDRVAIADVPNLTDKEYFVRGCTALLDAVGGAIHHIGNVHKYARKEGPHKCNHNPLRNLGNKGIRINVCRAYDTVTVNRKSLIRYRIDVHLRAGVGNTADSL